MAFRVIHNFLPKKSFLTKSTFSGSWDFRKKVQKGPEAPKPILSEGGWVNSEGGWENSEGGGYILKVVGKF